jgi:hypothetical protein
MALLVQPVPLVLLVLLAHKGLLGLPPLELGL